VQSYKDTAPVQRRGILFNIRILDDEHIAPGARIARDGDVYSGPESRPVRLDDHIIQSQNSCRPDRAALAFLIRWCWIGSNEPEADHLDFWRTRSTRRVGDEAKSTVPPS
jgi:hypothetical protein